MISFGQIRFVKNGRNIVQSHLCFLASRHWRSIFLTRISGDKNNTVVYNVSIDHSSYNEGEMMLEQRSMAVACFGHITHDGVGTPKGPMQ